MVCDLVDVGSSTPTPSKSHARRPRRFDVRSPLAKLALRAGLPTKPAPWQSVTFGRCSRARCLAMLLPINLHLTKLERWVFALLGLRQRPPWSTGTDK